MKAFRLFVFLVLPFITSAQTITGFVYDAEATIKGARLVNKTRNTLNYTNDKGFFQIEAKPNDTIIVFSYFHLEKTLIVTNDMFQDDLVIELKKITNALDTVEISKVNEQQFDSLSFSKAVAIEGRNTVKTSIMSSGTNYEPTLNVLVLAKVIGDLFKRKNKTSEIEYVTVNDLDKLFASSFLFNEHMLISDFNLAKNYHYLFFEYCSAQNITKNYLSKNKEVELLELLNSYNKAFHKLIQEYKK